MVDDRIEMQELVCHCGTINTFPINVNRNGNFVIVCKGCAHEHCRVCRNGVVTDIRFDSREGTSRAIATERKYTQAQLKRDDFMGEAWLHAGSD